MRFGEERAVVEKYDGLRRKSKCSDMGQLGFFLASFSLRRMLLSSRCGVNLSHEGFMFFSWEKFEGKIQDFLRLLQLKIFAIPSFHIWGSVS